MKAKGAEKELCFFRKLHEIFTNQPGIAIVPDVKKHMDMTHMTHPKWSTAEKPLGP